MLNPYRRALRLPGRLGACLVTGTEKIRCGYGNGDCLLLDFRNGIFAVADATERFPQASRMLLERLAAEISGAGPPANASEFETLLSRVWSQQKFIHKTTLSCLVLLDDEEGRAALLANNGDSSIIALNANNGTTLVRTAVDMNFAGRSRRPNPVTKIALNQPGTTIVLATDGLSDIGDIRAAGIAAKPDHLSRWIGECKRSKSEVLEIDDIGVIAVAAAYLPADCDTVIMGGTRPGRETNFVRSSRPKAAMDRWESIAAWQQSPELMDLAGIRTC